MTEASASRVTRPLLWLARFSLPLAVTVALSVLMGLLSWYFWVILLFPVVLGAAIGWSSVFGAVALGGRRLPLVAIIALTLIGHGVEQFFEDSHQRRAFAETLSEARAASSGLSPAEIERVRESSGTEFLARDAEAILDAQLEERLGVSGPVGRWVSRLEAGIRLGGPYRGGRGLDVGLAGGLTLLVFELCLVVFLAHRIGRVLERPPEQGRGPDA